MIHNILIKLFYSILLKFNRRKRSFIETEEIVASRYLFTSREINFYETLRQKEIYKQCE